MSNSLLEEMGELLSPRQACTPEEKEKVKIALAESDFSHLASWLEDAGASLTKMTLPGLHQLGRLPTCFANLGSYVAQKLFNEPRFRVCQAVRILNSEEAVDDGKKQSSLKYHKQKIDRGQDLGETIVIFQTPKKIAIVTCNTRASAIYDAGKERPVDVFVLAPTSLTADNLLQP